MMGGAVGIDKGSQNFKSLCVESVLSNILYEYLLRFEYKNKNFKITKYGFFYYPFKSEYYYFEIIYLFKKGIYIVFNVFIIPLLAIQPKFKSKMTTFINIEIILIWIFLFYLT